MKTIKITECRRCFAKFHGEDKRISIGAYEEVDIILKRIAKCSFCKEQNHRSIAGYNKRLSP